MYKLEFFTLQRNNYDPQGNLSKKICNKYAHDYDLKYFQLNCDDEHLVRKQSYQRLSLKIERILGLYDIPEKLDMDDMEVLNPIYNLEKVCDERIPDPTYEKKEIVTIKDISEQVLTYTQKQIHDYSKLMKSWDKAHITT